ncbi:putative UPF0160 protein C27H6.8 [Xylaria sp. CBS 124048]|nr:putative UPF0160 protein C27H6.8 [Xylaria sp. CBS 124048]
MAENVSKRLKTDSGITIGTHNGHFHADEALAVHMLRQLPTYAGAALLRSRDPAALAECHTIVDVGGEYDPARNRYDHHQKTFDTTFPNYATRLSSAGLVYMHFGRALLAQKMGQSEDSEDVGLVWRKMYESFIEAVDAHDNGISKYDTDKLAAAGIEPRYSSGGYSLGALVGRCNRNWNDPVPSDPVAAQAAEDALFETASQRLGEEFDSTLNFFVSAWLPARAIVRDAYAKRKTYDPQGRIMVLEGQSVPWKDHLYTLEEEAAAARKTEGEEEKKTDDEGKLLYVLYPENPNPGAKWRIQAVSVTQDSFQSRKALPAPWRGVREDVLDEVSGIPGCVFVHASGFTGGHRTFEGVKTMADKACAFEA